MDANIFELDMYFYLCLILTGIIIYNYFTRSVEDIQKTLKKLKKSLIRIIVFYQSHYSGSDQIALIVKWLDNIDKDEVPKWQQNELKNKVLDKFK